MDPDRKSPRLRYTVENFKKAKGRIIPLCQVKELNGKPAIFIEGKPLAGIAFQGGAEWTEVNKKIGETGIVIFTPGIPVGWKGPGKFDYKSTDFLFTELLKAAPDALIFPRIGLNTTLEWQKMYPKELCLFHDAPRDPESVKRIFEIYKHDPGYWGSGRMDKVTT